MQEDWTQEQDPENPFYCRVGESLKQLFLLARYPGLARDRSLA